MLMLNNMLYLSCRLNTTRLQDQLTEDQYSSLSTALDEIIAVLTTREDDGDVQPLDDQAPAGKNKKNGRNWLKAKNVTLTTNL